MIEMIKASNLNICENADDLLCDVHAEVKDNASFRMPIAELAKSNTRRCYLEL